MILLEKGNRILGETVSAKINNDPEEKVEPIDVKLCDFDDVSYKVTIEDKTRNIMTVSMNCPCYNQIAEVGGKAAFEKAYGDLVTEPLTGFDLSIKVDLDTLKEQKTKDELVQRISYFKAIVIGGVFDYFFDNILKNGKPADPFKFDLRSDTTVYFFPKPDRCTVIYSLDFHEKVDRAIAKIFMQEFVEARRSLGAAPSCMWSVQPPMELEHYKITQPTGNLGFISFAVLKNHLDSGKKDRVINVLQSFRNYIQYHIKCSKSHFHSRMRARCVSLLQVLNRAKAEVDPRLQPKVLKTAQGKTFIKN